MLNEKCFWISWFQPTEDHRPLTYPPNEKIVCWWCTGTRVEDNASTLVAFVIGNSEEEAKAAILKDWPEAEEWRFCQEKENKDLSDRFPLSDWMKERMNKL